MNIKLDWSPRFDEKSRQYRIGEGDYSTKYKYWWPMRKILNQGEEGACVGHGWAAALGTRPLKNEITLPDMQTAAFGIYRLAQFIDEWEGENYSGTSVLAGAKVAKHLGMISSYKWCFNVNEAITALHETGPLVIGVPWYEGMYETDQYGIVQISGENVGGHCLMIYAYNPRKYNPNTGLREPFFYWRNSWGEEYGKRGSGYISVKDMERLISEQSEICVPSL